MKNKKRLAVIAMSAIMAITSLPYAAFASDFSDGTEVVTEAVEEGVDATVVGDATNDDSEYRYVADSAVWNWVDENNSTVTIYKQKVITDANGNVSYGEPVADTRAATFNSRTEATCEVGAYVVLSMTFANTVYKSGEVYISDPLGHDWDYTQGDIYTVTTPTCEKDGLAHVKATCSRCGKTDTIDLVLDATGHSWGEWVYLPKENVKSDDNGYVLFDSDGYAVLEDETKDGYYYKTRYCTVCKKEDTEEKTVEVRLAKKGVYAVITEQSDTIATNLVDGTKYTSPSTELPLDESDIEMSDCSKTGYYVVTYYNATGDPISHETVSVSAHHYDTYETAVFTNEEDQDMCTVTVTNGKVSVTNKSCYLSVDYTIVTHCSAKNCSSTTEHKATYESPATEHSNHNYHWVIGTAAATAAPAGDHIICTVAKKAIAAAVKEYSGNDLYNALVDIAEACENKYGKDHVKITDRPDCETGGNVTVSYICVVDGSTVVETETIYIAPSDHKAGKATTEDYEAPSCTSTGKYKAVTRCVYCNKVLDTRAVIIPRTKHTNEISVDANGVGTQDVSSDATAYIKFTGNIVVDNDGELYEKYVADGAYDMTTAYWIGGGNTLEETNNGNKGKAEYRVEAHAYTKCDVCGGNEHEVTAWSPKYVTLTVKSVTKDEKSTGAAGSITLLATYVLQDAGTKTGTKITKEYTVPYFSTIENYQGRTIETSVDGLTKDETGNYRYYTNGEFDSSVTGIVDYAGGKFFVTSGVLDSGANGLQQNVVDKKWYYLSNGQVATYFTGLALYDGEWFYIVNGVLDENVNGLVPYNGGYFLFASGRLLNTVNGLWQDIYSDPTGATWYYLALGQVQSSYTGVVEYNGAYFYVTNGKLNTTYSGTVTYLGKTYTVSGGGCY